LCAMLQNASGIILCHNHPSNNLTPTMPIRS
jgi:DNA repair protein RadC